jgi:hypothetical protein
MSGEGWGWAPVRQSPSCKDAVPGCHLLVGITLLVGKELGRVSAHQPKAIEVPRGNIKGTVPVEASRRRPSVNARLPIAALLATSRERVCDPLHLNRIGGLNDWGLASGVGLSAAGRDVDGVSLGRSRSGRGAVEDELVPGGPDLSGLLADQLPGERERPGLLGSSECLLDDNVA